MKKGNETDGITMLETNVATYGPSGPTPAQDAKELGMKGMNCDKITCKYWSLGGGPCCKYRSQAGIDMPTPAQVAELVRCAEIVCSMRHSNTLERALKPFRGEKPTNAICNDCATGPDCEGCWLWEVEKAKEARMEKGKKIFADERIALQTEIAELEAAYKRLRKQFENIKEVILTTL